jgi:hypothetical protein
MLGVKVPEQFGIVVRKAALKKHNVSDKKVLDAMETSKPFDENHDLLSFGPHFGQEASNEFIRRLESLGLNYGDDFIDFEDLLPAWCQVYVIASEDWKNS